MQLQWLVWKLGEMLAGVFGVGVRVGVGVVEVEVELTSEQHKVEFTMGNTKSNPT
jgi:hypothetical protein